MKLCLFQATCVASIFASSHAFSPNVNQKENSLAQIHQVTRSKMLMMAESSSSSDDSRRNFLQTAAATTSSFLISTTQQIPEAFAQDEASGAKVGGKIKFGDENIMSKKEHGTSAEPVQESLRYGVSRKTADKICSFNRRFAEYATYFEETSFTKELLLANTNAPEGEPVPITFYDSVTGKPLFKAPIGRSVDEFIEESKYHGWPSFRDQEVVWDNVRVLKNSGETVSTAGTHLGHNIPDRTGNRFCINLVSISGNPV